MRQPKKEEQLPGQIDIFGNVNKEVEKIKKERKKAVSIEEKLMQFNMLLDHEPPKEWIKVNKNFQNSKYIPIRIVEALLKSVFGAYQVLEASPHVVISDCIVYSVHLKVWHPVLKDWLIYSGIGGAPLHTAATGISIALHGNAPMARAYAITNAAKSIGKLFGSSLNNLEDEMIDVYNPEFKKIKKTKGSVGDFL